MLKIQEKRKHNLCFNCDEKRSLGHKCKKNQAFVLEGIGIEDELDEDWDDALVRTGEDHIQLVGREVPSISLQAMCGITATHTTRLMGFIHNQPVNILVDSGSTHNFINGKFARKLKLESQDSRSFDVLVANGDRISGRGLCKAAPLDCYGVQMPADFLLLPMGGTDIVLGALWMWALDDVTLNFKKLPVKFTYAGVDRVWQVVVPESLQIVDKLKMMEVLQDQGEGCIVQWCIASLA